MHFSRRNSIFHLKFLGYKRTMAVRTGEIFTSILDKKELLTISFQSHRLHGTERLKELMELLIRSSISIQQDRGKHRRIYSLLQLRTHSSGKIFKRHDTGRKVSLLFIHSVTLEG